MNKVITIDIIIPVFEEKYHLKNIADNLIKQQLPFNHQLKIFFVDDASTDGTADYIQKNLVSDVVSLVRLKVNGGPAIARNKGILKGYGKFIILIDADCLPDSSSFILEHVEALKKSDISCGALLSEIPDSVFWNKYQNEVFENRVVEYYKNKKEVFTTSNLAFTRKQFLKMDGFDGEYFFGFEDRDFLLRALEIGASITYTSKARVIHKDRLTISSICRKMNRGGRIESNTFRKRHPRAYREMPYYRVDVREHVYLSVIARFIAPFAIKQTNGVDKVLDWKWIPYGVKKIIVKSMTALCFMEGTCK